MSRLPVQLANASLLILLMTPVRPLFAEKVTIGDAFLDLEPPKGYCKASKDNAERPVVESLEQSVGTSSVVLMVFAHCDELKDFRDGKIKYFRRYGQYIAPAATDGTVNTQPPDVTRSRFVAQMAMNIRQPTPPTDASAGKSDRRYPDVPAGEVKSLGMIGSDFSAIYLGTLQGIKTTSGDQLKVASVGAVTLLKGIVITTDLFGTYTVTPNIERLLKEQKANIRLLVDKNE